MNLLDLLTQCKDAGIKLSLRQGKLVVQGAEVNKHTELLVQLKQHKSALTELLCEHSAPQIVPTGHKSDVPLSFNQRRIFLSSILEEQSDAYHMPISLRLIGELSVPALEEAISQVITRHEILRTSYQIYEGQISQTVVENVQLQVENQILLAGSPDVDKKVASLLEEHTLRAFDLGKPHPIRLLVIQYNSLEHIINLVIHHIAFDGWSQALFIDEVVSNYTNIISGLQIPALPLPVQYCDFALWQQNYYQTGASNHEIVYWQDKLRDLPLLHSIPIDYPRRTLKQFEFAIYETELDTKASLALAELAKGLNVTEFTLLYAAFNCLVARWGQNYDVVVGTPVAGRNTLTLENMIGFFINTVVLRHRFSSEMDFMAVLGSAKNVVNEAFNHQYYPFDLLVEALNPKRSNSFSPLFQIWFVMQNNEQRELAFPGVQSELLNQPLLGKYEISVYISQSQGRYQIQWCYADNLFDANTIAYVAQQFSSLLVGLGQHLTTSCAKLPIFQFPSRKVTPTQRVDNIGVRYDCLYQQFSDIVMQNPNAFAVTSTDSSLSYVELFNRAERLAFLLTKRGCKRVGLMLGHTANMVVAILAALKAKVTYVPLHPDYPVSRSRFVVEDANIDNIIHTQGYRDKVMALILDTQVQTILMDADSSDDDRTIATLESVSSSNDIAYILYTSGTTGKPKGVMQSAAGLSYYANIYQQRSSIVASDKVIQLSSFTFDSAVMDMFGTLLAGAQLQLLDIERLSALSLSEELRARQTTVLHCTPTLFRMLCAETLAPLDNIRLVVLGGEAVVSNDLRLFLSTFTTSCQLVAGYGLTESTMALQWWPTREELSKELLPLLGEPIEPNQVELLNTAGERSAIFEEGEIVIWLQSIAREYVNLPHLTKQKFVTKDGRRYLKTGDYGIYQVNGHIRFTGRKDAQLKINGIRVELAEIEGALRSVPNIKDAAVIPKEHGETIYLVAALEFQKNQPEEQNDAEMSALLRKKLPVHMIPQKYVWMVSLPRTHSGKIDRLALEKLEVIPQTRAVAAETSIEKTLLKFWQEVFEHSDIGCTDSFFQLGGHSLLLIKLRARIRDTFNLELQYQDLVSADTIRELAQLIDSLQLMKTVSVSSRKSNSMTI
jgi:amino acid adenylation domain-containing protein